MKQVKLQKVGKFIKAHGVHGNLLLSINDNIPLDLLDKTILEKEWVFVDMNGIPVPFLIAEDGAREFANDSFLIKLDEIDTNQAKKMCPANVYVNIAYIKDDINIENDYNSIVDFTIHDKQLNVIGKVEYLLDIKENPLIAVNYKDQEVLIPVKSEYIIDIDFEQKQINTNFPENYLNMLSQF